MQTPRRQGSSGSSPRRASARAPRARAPDATAGKEEAAAAPAGPPHVRRGHVRGAPPGKDKEEIAAPARLPHVRRWHVRRNPRREAEEEAKEEAEAAGCATRRRAARGSQLFTSPRRSLLRASTAGPGGGRGRGHGAVMAKDKPRAPARALTRGITAVGRSKAYHRRGLWALKAKHGGQFPTHPKQDKPAAAAAKVPPLPSHGPLPAVEGL